MVQVKKCDCNERITTDVSTEKTFQELKNFFSQQVELGIFKDIPVTEPFYVGEGKLERISWYANKWYKCNYCGCLWEFDYPTFPGKGFVRKFEDGIYKSESQGE